MPNKVGLIDYLKFIITTNLVVIGFLLTVKADDPILIPYIAASVVILFALSLVAACTAYLLVITNNIIDGWLVKNYFYISAVTFWLGITATVILVNV